jgi:Mn2+/Fe2+ NRAMP family transporter
MKNYWRNFAISTIIAITVCVIVALYVGPLNLPTIAGIILGSVTYLAVWSPLMVWLSRKELREREEQRTR